MVTTIENLVTKVRSAVRIMETLPTQTTQSQLIDSEIKFHFFLVISNNLIKS